MLTSTVTLFEDWRDYEPVAIHPARAGTVCMQKSCPHVRDDNCPYWGTLESPTTVTSNEVWKHKGYCPFYAT